MTDIGFIIMMFIGWAIGIAMYFLPTLAGYRKQNGLAIFALNLLLGWTFIGWVVALVWALADSPQDQPMIRYDRVATEQQAAEFWENFKK